MGATGGCTSMRVNGICWGYWKPDKGYCAAKIEQMGLFGASKGSTNVSRGFRGATGGCMGLMRVGCDYLTRYIV